MAESNEQNPIETNLLTRAVVTGDRKSVFSRYGKKPSNSYSEKVIRYALATLANLTIIITLSILFVLLWDAIRFFSQVSMLEFFFSTLWEPFGEPKHLGVLPLITGTMMVAFGSAAVALPLGFGTAVFLTQYATNRFQQIVTPIVEILGGIPTVVYGYFALTGVTPFLRLIFSDIDQYNALSASIVVGISILPMVSSLSVEALRAVPSTIWQAGYALGMRKYHVVTTIIIPGAISGIVASFMLAFARAIGETMAVTLAAGATPNMSFNYLESIQTMTSFIVQVSLGDTPVGTIEYYTRYAIALTLFVMTFIFNFAAARFVKRFREVYK